MIKITKEKWNNISNDFKGKWSKEIIENGWQPDLPRNFIGKRTVLAGCISDKKDGLLTENIHFQIV